MAGVCKHLPETTARVEHPRLHGVARDVENARDLID